ncbi:MarR family transcriptional regulator [candidate division KSB1 bacterium]|nr:MarR family transcriptional regulator [candidate division KSB1 bacterium]
MKSKTDAKLVVVMSKHFRKLLQIDRKETACHGVTLSQHYVIDALNRKNELTMNELSQEIGLAMSTLTRIVDGLVRNGYINRFPSECDRRKVCVILTDDGKELANNLAQCSQAFWAQVLASIPDEKKRDMVESFKLLNEALDSTDNACDKESNCYVTAKKRQPKSGGMIC